MLEFFIFILLLLAVPQGLIVAVFGTLAFIIVLLLLDFLGFCGGGLVHCMLTPCALIKLTENLQTKLSLFFPLNHFRWPNFDNIFFYLYVKIHVFTFQQSPEALRYKIETRFSLLNKLLSIWKVLISCWQYRFLFSWKGNHRREGLLKCSNQTLEIGC